MVEPPPWLPRRSSDALRHFQNSTRASTAPEGSVIWPTVATGARTAASGRDATQRREQQSINDRDLHGVYLGQWLGVAPLT
jgi:hypothetical protein